MARVSGGANTFVVIRQGGNFATGNGIVQISDQYYFASTTDRDAYFTSNPGELADKLMVAVAVDPPTAPISYLVSQYNAATQAWNNGIALARGEKGADGTPGETGATGATGATGNNGAPGPNEISTATLVAEDLDDGVLLVNNGGTVGGVPNAFSQKVDQTFVSDTVVSGIGYADDGSTTQHTTFGTQQAAFKTGVADLGDGNGEQAYAEIELADTNTHLGSRIVVTANGGLYGNRGPADPLTIDDNHKIALLGDLAGVGPAPGAGISQTFTYVVDSDEALAAWAGKASGNDYTSVLIKAGTWSLSLASLGASTAAINLSDGSTTYVEGEPGSLIQINVTGTAAVAGTCIQGPATATMYPTNLWPGSGSAMGQQFVVPPISRSSFAMTNVAVRLNIPSTSAQATGAIFQFCANMTGCTASASGGSQSASTVAGYRQCGNLLACTARDVVQGFAYSMDVIGCQAILTTYNTSSSTSLYGFIAVLGASCIRILIQSAGARAYGLGSCRGIHGANIDVAMTSTAATSTTALIGMQACEECSDILLHVDGGKSVTGVASCNRLVNIDCLLDTASSSSMSTYVGYSGCFELSNCRASVNTYSGFSFAALPTYFLNCTDLSNCQGIGPATGYSGCTDIVQCVHYGLGSSSSPQSIGTGFLNCTQMLMCQVNYKGGAASSEDVPFSNATIGGATIPTSGDATVTGGYNRVVA
jgi:hypothetical protein